MGGGGTTECARPGCPKNGTRTIPATLFSSNRAKVCKACYTWMRRHFQVEPNGKHVRCADHGTLPRCATMLQAFASTGIYPVQCSNTNLTKGISLPAGSTSLPPPPTKAAATRTSGRRGTTVARRGRKRAATSRASRTPRAAPGRRRRSNSGSGKVDDDEDYEPEDGVVDEASSDDDARAGAVSSSDDSEWGSEVDEDTELEDVHYHHHHHHFHATNSHSRSRRRGAGGRNTTATSGSASSSSSAPTPATMRGASRNTATPGLGTDAAGLNGGFYTGVDSAAMDAAYDSIMFDGPLAFGDAMNEDLELDVFSPASGSVRSSGGGALASPPTATPGTRASVTSAGYPMASPTGGYSAVTHKTSAKRVPKLQAPPPPRSNNSNSSNSSGWGSQFPSLGQSALEESWTGAPAAPPISEMEWDEAALPGAGIGMLSPFLLGDQTDSVTASLLEPRQETGGAAPPPPPSSQAMQRAPSHTPTPMRRSGMAQLGFMTRVNSSGSMASVSGLGLPQPTTLTPRASPAPYVSGLRATGSSSSSSSFASGPRASPPDVLDSIIVMPDYYRSDRMPGDIGGGDVDDEDWDMSSVSADEGPENRSSSNSAAWPAGIIRSATPAGVSSSSATVQFYRTLVISFHQVAASGAARAAAEARLAAGKCANASCSNAATTTLPRGVLELTCAGEPRVCSSCAAWAAHHFGMPAPVAAAAAKVASTVVGCEGNTECRHPTCATRLRAMATSGFVLFHAASPTPAASPGGPSPLASPTSAASGLVTTPYRLLDRLGFGRGPYDDGFTLTTIGSTSASSTSSTSASMSSSGAALYSTSAPSTTGGGFGSGAMVPRHRDLRKYEVRHCVHATGLRGSLLRVSSLGAAARAGAGALHDAGATYQCTVCFKKLRPCSACGEALVGSYARTHPGCKSTTTKSSLNLPLGQHNTVGGELSDVSAMEAAIGQL